MIFVAMATTLAVIAGGCSVSLPIASLSRTEPVPAPVAAATAAPAADPLAVTGSVRAFAAARLEREPRLSLSDHLGPEDLRRAKGAMALALDPQGNGSPVSWDNAESKASGRFMPVGGPFLLDDEVCRAFRSQISTQMDKVALQGTACRPSGGAWSIRDMKRWKQPA